MQNLPRRVPLVLGLALAWTLASGCRSSDPARTSPPAPLRIGAVADSPPLIYLQKGQWKGVEADLGRALAARLGMKPVFVALPPEQLANALLDGKVDLLMAGMAITEERRVLMDFSTPYLVGGQAALIRSSDLLRYNTEIKIRSARARIGMVEGSAGDRLVSRYFTNAARTAFPRIEKAVDALRQNQIDLLIHDAPSAWWLVQHQGPNLALAPALFAREEIAWAFRRGSVTLRDSANEALADWQKDGSLETILHRWIPFSK
jgi:polar amino acid transport system substrate-binding protein